MTKLCIAVAGSALFVAGVATGLAVAREPAPVQKVVFDNPRATVNEITLGPGQQRPPRTRETDELVLFPDEAHYQAVDAAGKKEPRDRTPGTVVFHKKGEVAPTLVNISAKTVRYFSISLK